MHHPDSRLPLMILDESITSAEGEVNFLDLDYLIALKRDEETLNQYCYGHGKTTVMDAVKNMGLGK